MLFQLTHPLAFDALKGGLAGEVKAHDHGIAAFVGQSTVMVVLESRGGILNGDLACALACLEVCLVEVEGVSGAHSVNEEVLGELHSKCGLAAPIIANKYNSLLRV